MNRRKRLAAIFSILSLVSLGAAGSVVWLSAADTASASSGAPRCVPTTLNRSAVLPGTSLAVSPLPYSYDASQNTQISLLGAPPSALGDIRVNGSSSGAHAGRLLDYSQGDGASFVPSKPFDPGETVTVSGKLTAGSRTQTFAFHFVIARQDTALYPGPTFHPNDPKEQQHFHTRPELKPPLIDVTASSPLSAPGDIFMAPYGGPGPSGPMILDEAGNLVWFDPLPSGVEATNLQVQQYEGAPALTWWQGHIVVQGFGRGEELIDNSSYQQIARVRAGNGYEADLHDFHLMPGATALLSVQDPIDCNLTSVGGGSEAAVTDSIFQEIDLRTGLVRREWHSLDHVGLGDSYNSATSASTGWPYDYFHVNSIDQTASGTTLISARNTWALYELNTLTGQVLSTIGGKHSSVKLAAGAATAFQHDATVLANGAISVFDNGGVPKAHAQSRALVLSLNPQTNTDTVIAQYEHPSALSSGSQGDVQTLPNGDVFVGWGSEPYFSEFSAGGQLLLDAHMHGSYQSYRTYRFAWTGTPSEPPAIAVSASSPGVTVYASWNGDTRTASWRVLAGATPQALAAVASAARSGFETAIALPASEAYVAVQALNGAGEVIGSSRAIAG